MRENVGSLASYTEEGAHEGFMGIEDVPPLVVRGKLANNGKWAQLNFVSHIAGRERDDRRGRAFDGHKSFSKGVFAALETQVERVLRGENVEALFALVKLAQAKLTAKHIGAEGLWWTLQM